MSYFTRHSIEQTRIKTSKSLLVLLLVFSFGTVNAQNANQYTFTAFSSPYSQIFGSTGITNVASIQADDNISGMINIGFTFYFCGQPYTQVSAASNGWMTFGAAATVGCGCGNNITTGGYQPGLFPLSSDLHGGYPISSPASSANYITTGAPGSRVFTFEWYGWSDFNALIANEYSMQVILYEGTNRIQFAYRRDANASTFSHSPGIGIARTTGDFQSLPNFGASPTPSTTVSFSVAGLPATNQVYEWDPPQCNAQPTPASITNTPSVLCSGNSLTLNATTTLSGIGGITYQWQQSTTGPAGPWTNIPGATSLTYTTPVLTTTSYFRITDSCNNTVPHTGAASPAFTQNVTGYSIPYIQNFDFASNPFLTNFNIPACMQRNTIGGTSVILSTGFDNGFPPSGWNNSTFSPTAWSASASGVNPSCSPHSPGTMAFFNSFSLGSGSFAELKTPALNMSSPGVYTVSMWMFRDPGFSGTPLEGITVYATTSTSAAGTSLGFIPRYNGAAPTAGTGWFNYTFNVPVANQTAATYIIFRAFSQFGNNIYLDDVTVTYTSPPSQWGQLGLNQYKAADGTVLPFCVYATDTSGNANGKQDYITTPALPLVQGITYRARFGYARGASNSFNNTGTAPNNENLYLMVGTTNPGTNSSTIPLGSFPGSQIWSGVISSNSPTPTTANFITYTAPATAPYFFSWIDNTTHVGAVTTPNGTVALDSIRIDSVGCTLASITQQPIASNTVCTGFPITFSVGGAGYGLTYQWYKNGVLIPLATASAYTIASASSGDAGNYTVVITGTCGSTNSITSNIAALTVIASPPGNILALGPTNICPTTTVTINAPTGTGYTYQWLNGGVSIPGATSLSYAAGASGIYQVTVTNSSGCYTTSNSIPVTVMPAPPAIINAAGPTTLCQGNCVTLNANTGAGLSHQWSLNGVTIPGATTSSYLACAQGTYTVTVTGANGCFSTSPVPVNVIVNPLPIANVSASGADTFCQNQSVTLTGTLSSGVSYQWYNGTTALPGQTTNTYIATQTGSYSVKVTNTTTGCFSSSTISTVLMNTPTVTISSPNTSLCAGNNVTLTANASNAQGTFSYQWNVNGFPIPGATASTLNTNNTGSYTVTVTATTGSYSCSKTSQATILQAYSPPPAYITVSGATTFCAGNIAILHADTGTGYSYQWMLNGVNLPAPAGTDSFYTATVSGNYSVKVTNQFGCSGTSPATTISVVALPAPVITASGTTQLCPGGSVTLSTATGPGLSYQWYNGTAPIPGATFPTIVSSSTATYTVAVTNSTNCVGQSAPLSVVMNTIPSSVITVNGSNTICAGASVLLNTVNGVGFSYQWLLNGSPIPGANSSTYAASGNGSYSVTVTNGAGCNSTSAVAAVISQNAVPIATITSNGPTSVCTGGNVTLTANSGTGYNYQWNINGTSLGASATGQSYNTAVGGNFTVTVTDGNGCSNTSAGTLVSIYPIPVASLVPSADTGFCVGSSVVLTAVAGSGYTYQWLRNGNNIPGAININYQATQAGLYAVKVTENICSATSATKNIYVYSLPADTTSLLGSAEICINDSVEITAQQGSGFVYQWLLNGMPINGANQYNLWAKLVGVYTANVTSNYGCQVTTQPWTITQFPAPNPLIIGFGQVLTTGNFVTYQWYMGGTSANNKIPGATANSYHASVAGDYYVLVTDVNGCSEFSPKYTISDVGIKNINGNSEMVSIYPNPATTLISVDAPIPVKIRISGLDGRMLIEQNNMKTIDISSLANGVYMINVYDMQNTLLKTERLVKTNQ